MKAQFYEIVVNVLIIILKNNGIAIFIKQLLITVAIIVYNRAISAYGEGAMAVVGINLRVLMFGMSVIYGLCLGFQPIVGFNYEQKILIGCLKL